MAKVVIGLPLGNSVIGEVVKENEDSVTLENPLEVMVIPDNQSVRLSLIPFKFIYAEAVDPTVTLKKNKTLFVEPLGKFPDLEKGYAEEVEKLVGMKAQRQQQANKPQIIT